MQAKRLDHIAIAVKDLEAAVQTYQRNFGLQQVKGGNVPSLGIRQAFLQIGDAQIELITPLTEQGPVAEVQQCPDVLMAGGRPGRFLGQELFAPLECRQGLTLGTHQLDALQTESSGKIWVVLAR